MKTAELTLYERATLPGHWLCASAVPITQQELFNLHINFPDGASDKELTCQCRKHKRSRFNPWVGKIPWGRKWQPTPVFLPGELHGQRSLAGYIVHGVTKRHDWSDLALHSIAALECLLFPFYRWGNWGPARQRNLPQVHSYWMVELNSTASPHWGGLLPPPLCPPPQILY